MQLVQLFIISFFVSFIISSSRMFFGLPSGRVNICFHLYTLYIINYIMYIYYIYVYGCSSKYTLYNKLYNVYILLQTIVAVHIHYIIYYIMYMFVAVYIHYIICYIMYIYCYNRIHIYMYIIYYVMYIYCYNRYFITILNSRFSRKINLTERSACIS